LFGGGKINWPPAVDRGLRERGIFQPRNGPVREKKLGGGGNFPARGPGDLAAEWEGFLEGKKTKGFRGFPTEWVGETDNGLGGGGGNLGGPRLDENTVRLGPGVGLQEKGV